MKGLIQIRERVKGMDYTDNIAHVSKKFSKEDQERIASIEASKEVE